MLQSTGYKTKKATQKNTYIYTYTSNHIQIINISTILILGWKSFAVNDCLYTGDHGHHHILEMFCQVFNAATLGCCLFVGLSAFSLVFNNWKACSIGLRSGRMTWPLKNISFHQWPSHGHVFWSMFRVIIHLHCETVSYQFCTFGWLWVESIALKTSEFILLLLSAVTSLINTCEPVPLGAIHVHAITLPPPCLTLDVVCFGSWAVLFFHHTSLFPSSYQSKESYSRTWEAFF